MNETITNITYLILVILLPIIPAYLLFQKLKSSADAQGKVAGLAIKLSGAFAGYFIVFYVLYFKLPNKFIVEKKKDWVVMATLKDQDGQPLNEYAKPTIKLKHTDKEIENCVVDISLPPPNSTCGDDIDYKLWIEDESQLYASSLKFDLHDSVTKYKSSRVIQLGTIKLIKLNHNPKEQIIPADSVHISQINN